MAEQVNGERFKLKMPPEFSGERGESKGWLQKCTLYFLFNRTQFDLDEKKVIFALMLMTGGTAGPWASDYITQAQAQANAENGNQPSYGTWASFQNSIKESFEDVDDAASARVLLRNLAQGKKPIDEYIIDFKNIISRCGISQFNVIADFFYQGLNKPLRDKMFGLAVMPTDAVNLYKTAAHLEQQWRLGQAYDRGGGQSHKKNHFIPRRYNHNQAKERDPDAMDVDRMTAEEHDKHYKEGQCFNCHEIGHLSRNCPKKNGKGKQPFRKNRVMEAEEEPEREDDDEASNSDTRTLVAARIRTALQGISDPAERKGVLSEFLDEGF